MPPGPLTPVHRIGQIELNPLRLDIGRQKIRLIRLAQTATLEPRPLALALPLLAAGLWSVLLVMRKLWAAEHSPGAPFTTQLRRAALAPQSRIGAFYRWLLLAAGGLVMLLVFFNAARLMSGSLPLWLLVGSDLLDHSPRKVYFFPATGRLLVRELRSLNNDTLAQRERQYSQKLARDAGGKVELFR